MSQSTARKSRRTAAKKPAAPEPQPEQVDGVLVRRVVDDEGNLKTEVQVVGDVRITEAQTLLELGLRGFRKQIGLTE